MTKKDQRQHEIIARKIEEIYERVKWNDSDYKSESTQVVTLFFERQRFSSARLIAAKGEIIKLLKMTDFHISGEKSGAMICFKTGKPWWIQERDYVFLLEKLFAMLSILDINPQKIESA